MAVALNIEDGSGNKTRASVDNAGALVQAPSIPDTPPVGVANRYRYHSNLVGTLGAGAGTTSMNVNGAVTPVVFYIAAHPDYDLLIRRIVIVMVDGSIAYNKFGAISPLANGWTVSVIESGQETMLVDAATTTGEIITGLGVTSKDHDILANFDAANNNAFIVDYDVSRAFPSTAQGGIRLGRGTKDRVTATVRDDLQLLVNFELTIIGTKHYPIDTVEMA